MLRSKELDLSVTPETHYYWKELAYGNFEEVLTANVPKPLGKHVVTISYYDPNLYYSVITSMSSTRVLHFMSDSLAE